MLHKPDGEWSHKIYFGCDMTRFCSLLDEEEEEEEEEEGIKSTVILGIIHRSSENES